MTMSEWQVSKTRVRPQHYGAVCRSFFVPGTTCQALVLGCLAPCAQIPFWVPVSDTLSKAISTATRYLIPDVKKVAASILGATRSMNRTITR